VSKALLAALWIVTLYLTVVVAVTAVLLLAPVKMTTDEACVLMAFLGGGDLALIAVALWALVRGRAPSDEPKSN
jgi:hypothetical protein